jgi:threonylcarbamoyladenosine tRNA methylthiotransferase MtaB
MSTSQKIAFHTLGCKLNFSETSSMANQAIDAGYQRVEVDDQADIYVVNTCSVTENADKECRYIVRKIKRLAPESKVIILGCYAQLKPKEIAEIEGVDMVLGATEKFNLLDNIDLLEAAESTIVKAEDIKEINEFIPSFSSGDRTRTFLKVQDGCDYFCTFCTIPLARGRSRSQSIEKTMETFQQAVDTGVREIVLTGVNTGDFGKTSDGKKRTEETFYDLVREIDIKYHGTGLRVRVSSIEPNLITDEIVKLVSESDVFMPHFHIPLQSGSDEMLESMQRKYNSTFYRNKITYIKSLMPHAAIGVDVIVGYPEETDTHFDESFAFVNSLPVSYLHVFTYSERANTRAVKSEVSVPIELRRERNKKLRILSDKLKRRFYEEHLGREYDVLFEHEDDNGFMNGYTSNYIRVRTKYDENLVGKISKFKLDKINPFLFVEGTLK